LTPLQQLAEAQESKAPPPRPAGNPANEVTGAMPIVTPNRQQAQPIITPNRQPSGSHQLPDGLPGSDAPPWAEPQGQAKKPLPQQSTVLPTRQQTVQSQRASAQQTANLPAQKTPSPSPSAGPQEADAQASAPPESTESKPDSKQGLKPATQAAPPEPDEPWTLRMFKKHPNLLLFFPLVAFILLVGVHIAWTMATPGSRPLLVSTGQAYAVESYAESIIFGQDGKASFPFEKERKEVPYQCVQAGWSEVQALSNSYNSDVMWISKTPQGLVLPDGHILYPASEDQRLLQAAMKHYATAVDSYLSTKQKLPRMLADLADNSLGYKLSDGEKREPEMERINLPNVTEGTSDFIKSALTSKTINVLNDITIDGKKLDIDLKPNEIICLTIKGVPTVNRMIAVVATDKDGKLIRLPSTGEHVVITSIGQGIQEPASLLQKKALDGVPDHVVVSTMNKTQALQLYGLMALAFVMYFAVQQFARFRFLHKLGGVDNIRGQPNFFKRLILENRHMFAMLAIWIYIGYVGYVAMLYIMH